MQSLSLIIFRKLKRFFNLLFSALPALHYVLYFSSIHQMLKQNMKDWIFRILRISKVQKLFKHTHEKSFSFSPFICQKKNLYPRIGGLFFSIFF